MYREASSRRPTVTKTLKLWPLNFPPPFLEPLRWFLGARHAWSYSLDRGVQVSRSRGLCLDPGPLSHGRHHLGEVHTAGSGSSSLLHGICQYTD